MSIVKVWKPTEREPLTWRHFVVATYWALTVIPMILLIGAAALYEKVDQVFGQLQRWANPVSYGRKNRFYEDSQSPWPKPRSTAGY